MNEGVVQDKRGFHANRDVSTRRRRRNERAREREREMETYTRKSDQLTDASMLPSSASKEEA